MMGGTDLIFYVARSVDVEAVVLQHFRQIWPQLVVEDNGPFDHGKDLMICKDQAAKELTDREGCVPGNHYIELMFSPKGQIVTHELQQVTIVVNEFDDILFEVVKRIQTDFLRGFVIRKPNRTDRNPFIDPKAGDLFMVQDQFAPNDVHAVNYIVVDWAEKPTVSCVRSSGTANSFKLSGWCQFANNMRLVETADEIEWPWVDKLPKLNEVTQYLTERVAFHKRTPAGETSPSTE